MRTWPLLTIRLLPHVGDSAVSKSKPLAAQISLPALGVAHLWCLMALALVGFAPDAIYLVANTGWPSANLWPLWGLATGFSVLAWAWMHRWFAKRLQGFTGDCLGAAQQVSEIAFYLGLALAWGLWPAGATP